MHIASAPKSGPIRIRTDALSQRRAAAGLHSNYALARAMGVQHTTVDRVLSGRIAPGPVVIAGLLRALPGTRFEDLFAIDAAKDAA